MVRQPRRLTEKYNATRLLPDSIYNSLAIQTLLNKFIKKGKKSLSKSQIFYAVKQFRLRVRRPTFQKIVTRILTSLRFQLKLVYRRLGKRIVDVPVPIRDNKRDIASLQAFSKGIQIRNERRLYERWEQELNDLTFNKTASSTWRKHSQLAYQIYVARVNDDKRWK